MKNQQQNQLWMTSLVSNIQDSIRWGLEERLNNFFYMTTGSVFDTYCSEVYTAVWDALHE